MELTPENYDIRDVMAVLEQVEKQSLLSDYQPKYDEDYLQSLRAKAKTNWLANTDPDQWLGEIRGNYDS